MKREIFFKKNTYRNVMIGVEMIKMVEVIVESRNNNYSTCLN
jgi:hypothetical protein